MADNRKFNVHHNILMRLLQLEKQGGGYNHNNPIPEHIVDDIKKEANEMTDKIYPEYVSRRDASLWLARKLQDINWIASIS